MFKNIIGPVQAWLLAQGRCVGCGLTLKKSKITKLDNNTDKVTCSKCGRVFIYEKATHRYRRALQSVT
jgi:predicted  nucleic acid-binding Zn-ribbon protein